MKSFLKKGSPCLVIKLVLYSLLSPYALPRANYTKNIIIKILVLRPPRAIEELGHIRSDGTAYTYYRNSLSKLEAVGSNPGLGERKDAGPKLGSFQGGAGTRSSQGVAKDQRNFQ